MAVVSEQAAPPTATSATSAATSSRWVVGTVQILSYCRYGDADARSVPSPGEAKLPNSVRSGYATHPTLLPPTAALLHHTTPHVRSEAGLFLSAFTFLQKNPPALFPALFLPFPSRLRLPLQSDAVLVRDGWRWFVHERKVLLVGF